MCGIAGVIGTAQSPALRSDAVGRMVRAMPHRGPDDEGIFADPEGGAALGMTRLAIFDPAHGHQPMTTPDGRHTLVFNGAIYNFRALRRELESAGENFRTACDTEVLLAALAHWGEGALARLRGMYAFARWDRVARTLLLARDCFGIKPLYFAESANGLVFASELNALLAGGLVPGEIDPAAVGEYLAYLSVPAPRTIYRGIRSLRPGECATWHDGRWAVRSYWNFAHARDRGAPPSTSREAFLAGLRHQLEDTIAAHRLADVPVGAFLSGGLDSAAIVGLMTRAGGSPLKTFSIGFGEAGFSEADEAAETARHLGTEHSASVLTGADVAGDIETLIEALDQPTGDGINTYYASRAARAGGVTVALSGLGGDELFGGYPSFRAVPKLARWLPAWRLLPAPVRTALCDQLADGSTRRQKLGDLLRTAADADGVAAHQRRVFSDAQCRALLSADVPAGPHPELARLPAELAGAGQFERVSAWELRTYMADVLLRDSDAMSMRHSLELRVPFVDRPLLEWLWRQPSAWKHTPGRPKSALAEALSDVLPPSLQTRRKRGFTLPFALWMRRELRPWLEETFSDASVKRTGLFQASAAQGQWKQFLHGSDDKAWSRLWSLAVLIAFVNRRGTPVAGSASLSSSLC